MKLISGLGSFGEVAHLRRPVVHLQVDVDMVVRAPRGKVILVPDTLQIGRQLRRPT